MSDQSLQGMLLAVTGADGFVGRHVVRMAALAGARVVGLSRSPGPGSDVEAFLDDYHGIDLRSHWPAGLNPDVVIHLAGRAAVGPSFTDPQGYIVDNSAMVTAMCEALIASSTPARIVGVSTGAVYAPPPEDDSNPLAESARVTPASPYAVSKLLVEHQLQYYAKRGLSTVVARPFNHVGPGQSAGFLLPDLLTRLRALPAGDELVVGDLDTERDYSDVRDVAAAYLTLAAAPAPRHCVYNVASGIATSGRALLTLAAEALGIDIPPTRVDPALVRPSDPRRIRGSSERLRSELGWAPRYALTESIADAVAASR